MASVSVGAPGSAAPESITPPVTVHKVPSPFANSVPPPEIIAQGAEAVVYRTVAPVSSIPAVLKFRPSKKYRHPILDERLTRQRALSEARVLVKLSAIKDEGISVPSLLSLEWDVAKKVKNLSSEQKQNSQIRNSEGGSWMLMEWIEGSSVKQLLRDHDAWLKTNAAETTELIKQSAEEGIKRLLRRIGKAVAAVHSKAGVVHGDLTTSNLMVRPLPGGRVNGHSTKAQNVPDTEGEIVLIDFGLAAQSVQMEDRAVDLYVLERAFSSTHPQQEALFDAEVLQHQDGYRGAFSEAKIVLKRLDEVRLRGRKRSMIG